MSGGESLHGIFIEVKLDETVTNDSAVASKLAEVCPVDIFADAGGRAEVVRENLDECVLCGLCLDVAPTGVTVRKLYDGTELRR